MRALPALAILALTAGCGLLGVPLPGEKVTVQAGTGTATTGRTDLETGTQTATSTSTGTETSSATDTATETGTATDRFATCENTDDCAEDEVCVASQSALNLCLKKCVEAANCDRDLLCSPVLPDLSLCTPPPDCTPACSEQAVCLAVANSQPRCFQKCSIEPCSGTEQCLTYATTGIPVCQPGDDSALTCEPNFDDCVADDSNLCDTNTKSDDLHCGLCNAACEPSTVCVDGYCLSGSFTAYGRDWLGGIARNLNQAEAAAHCAALKLETSQWRLPTLKELEVLSRFLRTDDSRAIATIRERDETFFLSSESEYGVNALHYNVRDGGKSGISLSRPGNVRCVRDTAAVGNHFRVGLLDWQLGAGSADGWAAAHKSCDDLVVDGDGWRLPTEGELVALAGVAATFANDALIKEFDRVYWSSTPGTTGNYKVVATAAVGQMTAGYVGEIPAVGGGASVRCVRMAVTNVSGDRWQSGFVDGVTHAEAAAYCNALSEHGVRWRLPTRADLYDLRTSGPNADIWMEAVDFDAGVYWTSEAETEAGKFYTVGLASGVNEQLRPEDDRHRVRCIEVDDETFTLNGTRWRNVPEGEMSWTTADGYCETRHGSPWRLPSSDELVELYASRQLFVVDRNVRNLWPNPAYWSLNADPLDDTRRLAMPFAGDGTSTPVSTLPTENRSVRCARPAGP